MKSSCCLAPMTATGFETYYCTSCEKACTGVESVECDPVNHPKHYKSHPSGIECIEVTRHMSFNIGNAIKYLWRADHKDAPIQDLKKAIWYINDEISKREKLVALDEGEGE